MFLNILLTSCDCEIDYEWEFVYHVQKILGLLQHPNTGSKRSVTHCSKLDIHRNRKFQHSDMKLKEFYI